MCYVDDRSFKSLMKFGNLDTHLYTKFCIQVGKWLIHKEYFRITNNRTSHGNTLSLTTGQSLWFTIKQMLDVKNLSCFLNKTFNLIFRNFSQFQTKCHIIKYGHMWIQCVVLEYHGDITVFWFYVIYEFVSDPELTA